MTALAIADAAVSVKRNVNNALADLVASGQLSRHTTGNVASYSLDRRRWADFLGLKEHETPTYRDWPRILGALADIDRWLYDPRNEGLDDYLRASEARRLVGRPGNTLAQAGIAVGREGQSEDYWPSFVTTVEAMVAALQA